ncbi:MAG: MarR family transcriptional regulator [Candidatus Dormiibacterota bacterium]
MGKRAEAPALEAIAAVRAAARYLHLMQDRWADAHGLSEGRMQLLFMLKRFGDGGGISLGHLADLQGVTPRTITGLVDNLEKAGLVERVAEPSDRRSILARLTPAGKARIESLRQPTWKLTSPLTAGFSGEELIQLRHLSLKLLANAQEMEKS